MFYYLIAFLCLVWITPSTATARPLDDVMASGVIRVAVYDDNKPWSSKQNGVLDGIDVEIGRAIALALKLKVDFIVFSASEDIGGDFRLNLWKGDLVGTPLADLMLQVPNDPILSLRDDQVFLTAPYVTQRIAYAYHVDRTGTLSSIDELGSNKVAVKQTSPSDVDLMTRDNGRLRPDAVHYATFDQAMTAYMAGGQPVIAGTRVQIQAAFHDHNLAPALNLLLLPSTRSAIKVDWELAGAVRSNSRDLAYAVGDIIAAMIKDGRMRKIFDKYGVTYDPPRQN